MEKIGILLVNLGTPDSAEVSDVRKYLDEFLMDKRVIDINPLMRFLLVKGIIVPFRGPKSARTYKEIWTSGGSPLYTNSKSAANRLQENLGEKYVVELSMRYGNPSISTGLENLKKAGVSTIKVVPMFPQYASATTGSVHAKIMEIVSKWEVIPSITFVNSFYDNPTFIDAFSQRGADHDLSEYDHILFSYHGLPQRQLLKADQSRCHCLKQEGCCNTITDINQNCYRAQCFATSQLIASQLKLKPENYTVCFQSKLGNSPWAQPYTIEVIEKLALQGIKRILVFCPAFTADCIETLYEIAYEYDLEFKKWGGEKIQLVESLNDMEKWVNALAAISTMRK